MPTVALIGFSTAGKSTILGHFKDILKDAVETLDTDEEIAKPYGGHIYLLYNKLAEPSNHGEPTKKATALVERREREILEDLKASDRPRLIGFGPGIVLRDDEWTDFLTRVKPTVFYLTLSPTEALAGLKRRRERHVKAGLEALRAFGSWDQDITTQFVPELKRWVGIEDDAVIVENIRKAMWGYLWRFETAARSGETICVSLLRENEKYKQGFYEKVTAALLPRQGSVWA